MKKFLFMGAIAAMLLGTASCSNDMEPEMTDGTVQFTIELPGAIESRVISDGNTANKLTVAVYDKDGKELEALKVVNQDIPHQTTVEFKLVKGQTYSFAFWAQAEGAPYIFDTANKTVNVDYTAPVSNAENRDAFYAYKTYTVNGPINETVKLYRPFAQLNFGADDLAAAAEAGIIPSQSQVKVSHVATAFNLASGETSGDQEMTFTMAALPTNTDPKYVVGEQQEYGKLVVNNKDYGWMAMNYFLVPGNETNVDVEMTLTTNKSQVIVPATYVPVKKNHRTNIVGSLFTEDANFNVIIDELFDQPDLGLMSDPDEIAAAIQTPNAVVSIAPGTTLNLDLTKIAEGVTINGNGSKLILNQATNKVNTNGVTITGFTIDNTEGAATPSASIRVNGANFTLKDCVFAPSVEHTFSVYLKNMTEDGVYNFDGITSDATLDRRIIGTECKGTVNISNSLLKSIVYPISTAWANGDCVINVTNTKLIGWTSFNTGTGKTYNFENCYFGKLKYGYFRPYGGDGTNTVNVKNCTFSDDYEGISPVKRVNIYITDSKFENGNAITKKLVDPKKDETLLADGNVYVDGDLIYNGVEECER